MKKTVGYIRVSKTAFTDNRLKRILRRFTGIAIWRTGHYSGAGNTKARGKQ